MMRPPTPWKYPVHGHDTSYDALMHENDELRQRVVKLQADVAARDKTIEDLEARLELYENQDNEGAEDGV